MVVWDRRMLGYDLGGNHPMHPLRWELTWLLAGTLGVLDGFQVVTPEPADDETLGRCTPWATSTPCAGPHGGVPVLGRARAGHPGQPDLPGHARQRGADRRRIGGRGAGDRAAARSIGRSTSAAGCTMRWPTHASGFCVYNDAALAIAALLEAGVRKVAYVDVDAHHGDGVQAAFYDDPRVLTVSIHQTPLTLFPGTGFPTECGARRGATARRSTSRCPPGTRMPRGCGPSTRWCPAWCGRSGRRCWSPSTAPTPTGRIRWPT